MCLVKLLPMSIIAQLPIVSDDSVPRLDFARYYLSLAGRGAGEGVIPQQTSLALALLTSVSPLTWDKKELGRFRTLHFPARSS
jgi:hypothetical protein